MFVQLCSVSHRLCTINTGVCLFNREGPICFAISAICYTILGLRVSIYANWSCPAPVLQLEMSVCCNAMNASWLCSACGLLRKIPKVSSYTTGGILERLALIHISSDFSNVNSHVSSVWLCLLFVIILQKKWKSNIRHFLLVMWLNALLSHKTFAYVHNKTWKLSL